MSKITIIFIMHASSTSTCAALSTLCVMYHVVSLFIREVYVAPLQSIQYLLMKLLLSNLAAQYAYKYNETSNEIRIAVFILAILILIAMLIPWDFAIVVHW